MTKEQMMEKLIRVSKEGHYEQVKDFMYKPANDEEYALIRELHLEGKIVGTGRACYIGEEITGELYIKLLL